MKQLMCICVVIGCLVPSESRMAFRFAAGIENLLEQIDETFSCDDKPYGYYADVQNGCKVFHVCNPVLNEEGEVAAMDHFSFVCGNQTVFSQETLTCSLPEDSSPCEEAPTLYELINSEFGKVVAAIRGSSGIDSAVSPFGLGRVDSEQLTNEAASPRIAIADLPNDFDEENELTNILFEDDGTTISPSVESF